MLPSRICVCEHTFDISHLNCDFVRYVQKARDGYPDRMYSVGIYYSNHVYSRKRVANDQNSDFLDKAKNERVFDYNRYLASYELPSIIEDLMNRDVFHANSDGSYMVTSKIEVNGVQSDYDVYFAVFETKGKLNLQVKTAYIRDERHQGNRCKNGRIGFSRVLFNLLNGKPIKACGR